MVVDEFPDRPKRYERQKMSQTSDPKTKTQVKPYGRETYTDRRARMFESSAERHAKRSGFLTGADVLKSAETEIEPSSTSQGEIGKGEISQVETSQGKTS